MKIKDLSTEFMFICKECYFEKITPANPEFYSNTKYQRLVSIAKEFFNNDLYMEFAECLEESQYFVALWTAHFLLEHGDADTNIKVNALHTILNYLDNPVFPEVSKEEEEWLKKIEINLRK